MATAMASIKSTSNARSVSFVGLTIAIMAVSAWVTVPLGPVPFTLQMFAIVFAVAVLKPREAIAAMAGYLILGAVGLPVFSGMRGGLGILAGPTGGFLWGSFFGVAVAAPLLHALRSRFGLAKRAAPHQSNLPSERDSRWREERCFLSEAPLASSLQV